MNWLCSTWLQVNAHHMLPHKHKNPIHTDRVHQWLSAGQVPNYTPRLIAFRSYRRLVGCLPEKPYLAYTDSEARSRGYFMNGRESTDKCGEPLM